MCIYICICLLFSADDYQSEDDINECEKEDPLHSDEVPHPDNASKKKRKKMNISMRLEG